MSEGSAAVRSLIAAAVNRKARVDIYATTADLLASGFSLERALAIAVTVAADQGMPATRPRPSSPTPQACGTIPWTSSARTRLKPCATSRFSSTD